QMKALSIRSPWWWYILHGGKDIENRDWATGFRGRVWIHAGKWWKGDEVLEDIRYIADEILEPGTQAWANPPLLSDLMPWRGCIVGSVEIVDCRSSHNSRWFFGKYGFVLRNPIVLAEPRLTKGALGFFDVPNEATQ